MGGRDALKEDLSFGGINVVVNPVGPCGQTLRECCETVHILIQVTPLSYIIPPANPQSSAAVGLHFPSVSEYYKRLYERAGMNLRLGFSCVGPPVPRVEDQHVHLFPRISTLD